MQTLYKTNHSFSYYLLHKHPYSHTYLLLTKDPKTIGLYTATCKVCNVAYHYEEEELNNSLWVYKAVVKYGAKRVYVKNWKTIFR